MKQKKVVNRIIENHGNISKSMREVGYEENTCKNPKNLTESKGFKQLCEEQGLTDDFIIKCLMEDIQNKPMNRQQELNLASKIKGLLSDKIDLNTNMTITFDDSFKDQEKDQENE